jgi:hypothetical protein
MTIFKARKEDVPRILECAREFCAVLCQYLDEEHYSNYWWNAINDDVGAIFLLENEGLIIGGIGGIKNRELLSGGMVAVELFWYVREQYRAGIWPMRLLKEFENWSKDNDCKSVSMIHMEKSMPDHMKKVYSRLGYELIETIHTKKL